MDSMWPPMVLTSYYTYVRYPPHYCGQDLWLSCNHWNLKDDGISTASQKCEVLSLNHSEGKWIIPTTMWMSLGENPSLTELPNNILVLDDTKFSLMQEIQDMTWPSHARLLVHRKFKVINVLLKATKFVVTGYAIIDSRVDAITWYRETCISPPLIHV